jgi:hypothetical protein
VKALPGILVLSLALTLIGPEKIGAEKKHKPPDLEILQASARRGETNVAVDGRVRNTGPRPIKELTLVFDFIDRDNLVLTSERGQIDEEVLEPGQEAAFHMEVTDPPRSIQFRISAQDGSGRELTLAKSGPFPIE